MPNLEYLAHLDIFTLCSQTVYLNSWTTYLKLISGSVQNLLFCFLEKSKGPRCFFVDAYTSSGDLLSRLRARMRPLLNLYKVPQRRAAVSQKGGRHDKFRKCIPDCTHCLLQVMHGRQGYLVGRHKTLARPRAVWLIAASTVKHTVGGKEFWQLVTIHSSVLKLCRQEKHNFLSLRTWCGRGCLKSLLLFWQPGSIEKRNRPEVTRTHRTRFTGTCRLPS